MIARPPECHEPVRTRAVRTLDAIATMYENGAPTTSSRMSAAIVSAALGRWKGRLPVASS
jgi:hypothetical protein